MNARSLKWTPELVKAFWDFYAAKPDNEVPYFSRFAGRDLVDIVVQRIGNLGTVADFGSGPGHLVAPLLDNCDKCCAIDSSLTSLARVRERFDGHPRFMGTRSVSEAMSMHGEFDTVFLVETLEHLLPGEHHSLLRLIHNLVRPGGALVVTVPNNENLDADEVFCPLCCHAFHRWQHQTTWSADRVTALLFETGFGRLFCYETSISKYQLDRDRLPGVHDVEPA